MTSPKTHRVLVIVPFAMSAENLALGQSRKRRLSALLTPELQCLLLHRLGDVIAANAEALADMEVSDNGKLKAEMLGQMRYVPQWFYYYGGLADKVQGAVTPIDKKGMFHYITYEPQGVVAAITPWNSPLLLLTWKIAPALAAGCTVVVKPSEFTSASTLEFAELFEEAGFPPGVFNVVTGFGQEVGTPLVEHPLVAKVSFTGSDTTGRLINEKAARLLKHTSMELGGKSPNIVFEDADLDQAVFGAISGIFAATGQTCIAGSRLLVQDSIHDAFVEKLVAVAKTARMGDPMDMETQVGPVTTPPQYDKVLGYIDIARNEGAKTVLGGSKGMAPECGQGWFVEPTIFTEVQNPMRIAQEEVFGPVLSIIPFDTEDEAIAAANNTEYGLVSYAFTKDLARGMRLVDSLESGMSGLNTGLVSNAAAPFGGVKASGLGREGGSEGIEEYLETRYVLVPNL